MAKKSMDDQLLLMKLDHKKTVDHVQVVVDSVAVDTEMVAVVVTDRLHDVIN
jgi:hypothetical protein